MKDRSVGPREKNLDKWKELFKKEKNQEKRKDLKCPTRDVIISYATDELEDNIKKAIEVHLDFCTSCLSEVIDIRAAMARGEKITSSPLLSEVKKAIYGDRKQDNILKFRSGDFQPARVEKWFLYKSEGIDGLALAAKDNKKEHRIVLKIVLLHKTTEEIQFSELEIIDEYYDSGILKVLGRLKEEFTFGDIVGCYGCFTDENGKDVRKQCKNGLLDRCTYLVKLDFEVGNLSKQGIKEIILVMEET